jgi:hypothetical protein
MVTSGSTDLATVSAVFFAAEGVDDLEVFEVVAGVGAESQFHAVEFLDAHEQIGVFAAETFEDARVDEDAEGILFPVVTQLEPACDGGEAANRPSLKRKTEASCCLQSNEQKGNQSF